MSHLRHPPTLPPMIVPTNSSTEAGNELQCSENGAGNCCWGEGNIHKSAHLSLHTCDRVMVALLLAFSVSLFTDLFQRVRERSSRTCWERCHNNASLHHGSSCPVLLALIPSNRSVEEEIVRARRRATVTEASVVAPSSSSFTDLFQRGCERRT